MVSQDQASRHAGRGSSQIKQAPATRDASRSDPIPDSRFPNPESRIPRNTSPDINAPTARPRPMSSLYDFSVQDIDAKPQSLRDFAGRVLLIVNTASKCGFTPQYKGLEALHRKYEGKGLTVMGFPCDQFGHQEPGDEAEIKNFCSLNYDVHFPLFAKVEVNGMGAHPLFQYLKKEAKGILGSEAIKWNFTKFLIDREGRVVRRYAPTDTPESIERDIVELLG
jgi:glutathione peroxidase